MKKNIADGTFDYLVKMTNREALYWIYQDHKNNSLIPEHPIIVVNKESNKLAQKIRNIFRSETEFQQLVIEVKSRMLSLNQLSWIKKLNKEEVLYLDKLICDLSIKREFNSILSPTLDESIMPKRNLYLNQSLHHKPVNNFENAPRLTQILTFNIDYAVEGNLDMKTAFLNHLQSSLKESEIKSKEFISFINNEKKYNNSFEDWLLNHCNSSNFILKAHKHTPSLCQNNQIDYLKANIKYYYDNDSNIGNLKLILKEMKAAWSQKKHRDKNNGKRACNFQLTEESINLLNKISKQNRRKKNEMLEILIEKAWLERDDR